MSTCCAQHASRDWREDCAGSGDSDEDEDAEALAGFFRLVVEMWGAFCGYIAGGFGSAARLGAEGSVRGAERRRRESASA